MRQGVVAGRVPMAMVLGPFALLAWVVAWWGAQQASRGERVLGFLDGPFRFLRVWGEWLIAQSVIHSSWYGAIVLVLVAAIGFAAWRQSGRGALPVVCCAIALVAATWGQVALFHDALATGTGLYVLGILAALVWGALAPLSPWGCSVDAAGSVPPPGPVATRRFDRFDAALLFGLLAFSLLTRTYALTELPHEYECEMIFSMLSSSSLTGIRQYVPEGITSNTNGVVHFLPQWALFSLLGTSAYALRFTSAVCGFVCTVLFYLLTRRLGGRAVASVATLLFVTAPDQLFWSRQENTPFQFVTLMALLMASAAVAMAQRPSWKSVLGASACMPLARLFYGPAMVLLFVPPFLYAHALLTRRIAWRSVLYAVPMLAGGTLLWVVSLSTVSSLVSGEPWRFINPTLSAGAPVWQGEGTFRNASLSELLTLQAGNLAKNAASVARAATYRSGFTNWYRRSDETSHPTAINVVISVLLAVGIGYLVGQLREPRAFLLLLWVGLEMLPALLSVDPVPRRMVGAFPGFYAIVAVTLMSVVDQVRRLAPPRCASLLRVAIAGALSLTCFATTASYFLLPIQTTMLVNLYAGTTPVFRDTDAIFHNLGGDWALLLAFGHREDLFRDGKSPCYEAVRTRDLVKTILGVDCPYESAAMRQAYTPEQLEQLRAAYDPRRFHFLLEDRPATRRDFAIMRDLFPRVPMQSLPRIPESSLTMKWLATDRQSVDDLRTLTLHLGAQHADAEDLARRLMEEQPVQIGPATEDGSVRLDASLLLDRAGWFQLRLAQDCGASEIRVDGSPIGSKSWTALSEGAHALMVRLTSLQGCSLPLRIIGRRYLSNEIQADFTPTLGALPLSTLPSVGARKLEIAPGFRETKAPLLPEGSLVDFAVTEDGALTLLMKQEGGMRLVWLDAMESQIASKPLSREAQALSLAPDGTLFVLYPGGLVDLYSGPGRLTTSWTSPFVQTSMLGHLPNGQLLTALPSGAVVLLDRDGKDRRTWLEFTGGPGSFFEPWSVGVNRAGEIVVIQADGTALVFHTPADRFEPTFVRSFTVDFWESSAVSRGWTFDEARGRILVPDSSSSAFFVLKLDGALVMPDDPRHGLSQQNLEVARRIALTKTGVLVLDGQQRLRKFVEVDR